MGVFPRSFNNTNNKWDYVKKIPLNPIKIPLIYLFILDNNPIYWVHRVSQYHTEFQSIIVHLELNDEAKILYFRNSLDARIEKHLIGRENRSFPSPIFDGNGAARARPSDTPAAQPREAPKVHSQYTGPNAYYGPVPMELDALRTKRFG